MKKKLSIATTSYRSANFIELLVDAIAKECRKITDDFEIVVVDDASPDESWKKLTELCQRKPYLRAVRLARNFGQQTASSVAIQHSEGEMIILMDGDFENPISLFGQIIQELNLGNEIVYVVSKQRQNLGRKLSSAFFWEFCTKVLGLKLVKNQLMLRGMTYDYSRSFLKYADYIRNVAILNYEMGGRSSIIETSIGKRVAGAKSNFGFIKRFDHFIDLIILISNKPLTWVFFLGLASFGFSCIFLIYSLTRYMIWEVLPGYTSLIASIFLFGGLNLLVLALIGRYLANVYAEVRKRPFYRIEQIIN